MDKIKKNLKYFFYKKKSRRKLSQKQKRLLKKNLKEFFFKKQTKNNKKFFLEIGFGYGDNLLFLAQKNIDKIILGCEVYEPGIANLLDKINIKKIKNILIYPENIFSLFEKIKKNSIDKIFILFPDPWPKKKHHKRRLISPFFINEINKILKKEGIIFITTDSKDYLEVILKNFFLNKNFFWLNKTVKDCYTKFNDINESKYEQKANFNKNKIFYLKFKKIC